MAALTSLLPAPKNSLPSSSGFYDSVLPKNSVLDIVTKGSSKKGPPPYGQREGFVPRTLEDFGDGGAFPEIHVAQYPLDLGRKDKAALSKIVPVTLDAEGKVKFDAILSQGQAKPGAGNTSLVQKKIFAQHSDLMPKELEGSELMKPDEEEVEETTQRTKEALEKIVNGKIAAAQPVAKSIAAKKEPTYIRYTPSQQGASYNSGAKQRVIRLIEMPKDPLEPPKFRHKRVPKGPPSPPVPVMHSPPRKVTVKDQQEWKIPPCISNWKNSKGYTIPLDKRLAADGRGLQDVHINDNFAKLTEALYIAERTARDEIEKRAQIIKKKMLKEKEKKEEELRMLAQNARMQRAGAAPGLAGRDGAGAAPSAAVTAAAPSAEDLEKETPQERAARLERESLREDRKRERERDRRLEAAGDKRAKTTRDRDRDVSEQIALGRAAPTQGDSMFDQRLFNTTKGIASGFGEDDSYNVFDKPLFGGSAAARLYRPSRGEGDEDAYGGEEDPALSTARQKPDRDFQGVDRSKPSTARTKPVEFEKEEEADPFGLDHFLTEAKKGKKADKSSSGGQGAMQFAAGGGAGGRDGYDGSNRSRLDFVGERDRRR